MPAALRLTFTGNCNCLKPALHTDITLSYYTVAVTVYSSILVCDGVTLVCSVTCLHSPTSLLVFADVDRFIAALDHVVDYYNVSTDVDNVIRSGPYGSNSLDPFLNALDKLKRAQAYFEENNPQCIELENVVSARM